MRMCEAIKQDSIHRCRELADLIEEEKESLFRIWEGELFDEYCRALDREKELLRNMEKHLQRGQ